MKSVELQVTGDHAQLYRAVVSEAVNDGQAIMETVIRATRRALHEREASVRSASERQALVEARQCLNKYELTLIDRYPDALRAAFAVVKSPVKASVSVHFDQLELMDELQIMERVELARAEQVVVSAVELSLAVFNPIICAAAGLPAVRADHNPVRPERYVQALQTVVRQLELSTAIRDILMWRMGEALGMALSTLYARLAEHLRSQGVEAVGYAVRPAAGGFDDAPRPQIQNRARTDHVQPTYLSPDTIINVGSSSAEEIGSGQRGSKPRPSAPQAETLLTLDKLRKLLAGEFDRADLTPTVESFAQQFSREFDGDRPSESIQSDFDPTVPAALDALTEMKQVDQVIERIGNRKSVASSGTPESISASPHALGSNTRGSSQVLGQALSLEVVALMVDNMANDERLLKSVQDVIRSLEPALLRLALADPRFFSDKQHPARRLLQEITQRSLAYETENADGLAVFLEPLQSAVRRLAVAGQEVHGAPPFEQVLHELALVWDAQRPTGQLKSAMQALQNAEERNLLAEKIGREIAARPDAAKIPAGILDFLRGPWAQVMAHARLADGASADDPGGYGELVLALLWSTQPALTRKNVGKLTRLVPRLLGKLREGLALIDYPSLKTSAFFELLMNLHQHAFKSLGSTVDAPFPAALQQSLFDAADSWIAPAEAKLSGFMEAPPENGLSPAVVTTLESAEARIGSVMPFAPVVDQASLASTDLCLPVGSWVELMVNGVWIRTQLSWASAHGTLFLFTGASGSTQSMTRRSRDKLLAAGTMRIISGQAVVDVALDGVVRTAMNNSIDIRL